MSCLVLSCAAQTPYPRFATANIVFLDILEMTRNTIFAVTREARVRVF